MGKYQDLAEAVSSLKLQSDIQKFNEGNHTAGTRIRKKMAEIKRICQGIRDEVQKIRAERKIQKNKF